MSAPRKFTPTKKTYEAREVLQEASGAEAVSMPSAPKGAPGTEKGPGVTWAVLSSTRGALRQTAPFPHITGPNPLAKEGSVGASHHLTNVRDAQAQGFVQIERDASNVDKLAEDGYWQIAERIHQVVGAGATLGQVQHDQHLAIRTEPNKQGVHEVRSATVTAATHDQGGQVTIRTDSEHQPVSPRTVKRTFPTLGE